MNEMIPQMMSHRKVMIAHRTLNITEIIPQTKDSTAHTYGAIL